MQTVFSTDGLHPRDSFRHWRDMLHDAGARLEQRRLDDTPFTAKLEVGGVGPLVMTRTSQGAMRNETRASIVDGGDSEDPIHAFLLLTGKGTISQNDRSTVQRAGDLVMIDHRPAVWTTGPTNQLFSVQVPRARLESVLGSPRLYTALTIGADLASTVLTASFFKDLVRVSGRMTPDAADRMAAIGIDLIVASIAERLARELPRPLHGTVVVQRAKAHIEANLSDQTLDPPQLATAMGVSLRRLQELFHERGRHISDYIWHRRLEAAAKRLADPACAHLPIGLVAYGCGFTSQAHFARRFKERHGLTPREFRQAALTTAAVAAP